MLLLAEAGEIGVIGGVGVVIGVDAVDAVVLASCELILAKGLRIVQIVDIHVPGMAWRISERTLTPYVCKADR